VKKRLHKLQQTVSVLTGFLLVFQSTLPSALFISQAHAQEATASTDIISPTPTEEITPTVEPTQTIEPTLTETPTPTEEITPAPEPTIIAPTPTEVPQPTETGPPTTSTPEQGEILDGISTESEEGELQATIVKNVEAETLDLGGVNPDGSAQLSTDKADYAPTDTAIISGSDLTPNKTYSLTISSADDPAISSTVSITTDNKGTFIYAYQLDGQYRPNYAVRLTDESEQLVASVTFTDSLTTISATLNGSSSVTVYPNQAITLAVTATVSVSTLPDRWLSTGWKIDTGLGGYNCENTDNHTVNGTFTESFSVNAPSNVGTYNLYVRTAGAAGCNNSTGTSIEMIGVVNVIADVTAPTCPAPTISEGNHPGEQYATGNTIYYTTMLSGNGNFDVNVNATDPSGIQKVVFPATVSNGDNKQNSPYTLTYNWTSGDTFSDTATITCYDDSAAHNTATTTLNVYRDNTLPVVNSITLDKTFIKDGGDITITSNITETGSGISSCHAYWSTDTGVAGAGDIDLGDLGTDCSGTVTVPTSTGTKYIIIGGTLGLGDNVGLFATNNLASPAITMDNVAPTTTDDTGFGGQHFTATKTVTLTPTDDASGIADTKYCVSDNGVSCTPNISGTSVTVTCPGVSSCTKWVWYYSIDNAGNVEPTKYSYSFIIDNDTTPPVISKTVTGTAGDNSWYTSDVTVTWTVTDPDSAVTIDSGCGTQNFTSDTTGSTSSCLAHSIGGSSSDSIDIKIDKTNPTDPGTPTASVTSPTNQTSITWSWVATDALVSGIKNYLWSLWQNSVKKDFGITTDVSKTLDLSGYGEGDFTFDVQSQDNAGNTSSTVSSKTTTIDTTKPTINGVATTTIDGAYTIGQVIDFNLTFSEVVDVSGTPEFTVSAGPGRKAVYVSGSGTSTLTFNYTVGAADGTPTYLSHNNGSMSLNGGSITDQAGNDIIATLPDNSIFLSGHSIVIDTNNPTGSINSPNSGDYIKGTVTVNATADDSSGSGVSKVEFYHNPPTPTYIGQDTSAPYSFDWDTTGVIDGSHNIYIKVIDNAGNDSNYSIFIPVTIDNTAPSVPSVTTPTANGYINSPTTQTFAWTSSTDSGSGLATSGTYQYQIDNNSNFSSPLRNVSQTGTTKTLATPLADGVYYVRVRAKDAVGNYSAWSTSIKFTVDSTNPSTPSVTTPTANGYINSPTTQTFAWTSSTDSGSGLATTSTYQYQIDNASDFSSIERDVSLTATTKTLTNPLPEDSYYIRVRAKDKAGNYSLWSTSIFFTVDTTNPTTAQITAPQNNEAIKGTYTITGNASDNVNGSGIDTVQFWHKNTFTILCTDNDSSDGLYCDWNTTAETDGAHTIYIDAYDKAGNVTTSSYIDTVIDNTNPDEPTASPVAGDYMTEQSVTLSSADASSGIDKIYYTTDGTDPDNTKTEYTGTITVDKDMTIKAIAYDKAGNTSTILEAIYGIAPVISAETSSSVSSDSITITWTTDDLSTSRVVYDTVSHPILGAAPNYDYVSSTVEDATKVINHSVTLVGLSASTTYYYRVISHGSPETVSDEKSFTTTSASSTSGGGTGVTGDGLSDGLSDGRSDGMSSSGTLASVLGAFSFAYEGAGQEILGAQEEASTSSLTPTPTVMVEGETLGLTSEPKSVSPWIFIIIGLSLLGSAGYLYFKQKEQV
jgi:hypothetical protein